MTRRAIVLAVTLFGSHTVASQRQTFRAATDAVLVDVSVTSGNQPVKDLAPEDFALADNGVTQQLDEVGLTTMPIDLSLLVDTGSEGRYLGRSRAIQQGAAFVQSLLKAGDRGSLVTFDSQMRWGVATEDSSSRGERGTAILDAISTAVMTRVDPGRRHLIVVVTAGIDTHSLIPADTRAQILAKSEAPVYVVEGPPIRITETYVTGRDGGPAPEQRPSNLAPGVEWISGSALIMGDYSPGLRAVADATGGRTFDLGQGDSFQTPLKRAVDEFRTSYVLRYRPRDVSTVGWHTLVVKMIRRGNFNIKARKGYWRD